jgi:hypothetical protein
MRSYCFWAALFSLIALVLYDIKYNVHSAQNETRALEAQLIKERKRLQMVELEWTMLTRPERIKVLAEKHLQLQSLDSKQVMNEEGAIWRASTGSLPDVTQHPTQPTLAGAVLE